MPQLPPTTSRVRLFFRWTLVSLIVVAGIWFCVIVWWQSSPREIAAQEVVIYLFVIPAMVLAGLALFQWHRKRNADRLRMPETPSTTQASNAALPGDQADGAGAAILAAWCLTSAGNNLEDFRQALVEKKQRPIPDAGLLGDDGYPLLAARIPTLEATMQRTQEEWPGREAFSRTLAMLTGLLEQIESDWPLVAATQSSASINNGLATLRGSDPAATSLEPRLRLQIKLITPADFDPAEQQQALDWLNEKAAALPVAAENLQVASIPAQDDATPLLLIERFRRDLNDVGNAAEALLVIVSESTLCPSVVERLEAEQRLFGNHRPHGLMPGEAAFAILCVNQRALSFALQEPTCTLRRVANCRRDVSADGGARPSHASLEAITGDALVAAELQGDAIGAIACDADHRSNRVLECIGAMLRHTPQLDAIANRLAVNETCGYSGAASSAGGLVAGIAQIQHSGQPVLVFNVSHAFERAAAVLLPAGKYAPPT